MKILKISGGMPPWRGGGVPAYLIDLREELIRRGHRVCYLDTTGCAKAKPRVERATHNVDHFEFINSGVAVPFLSASRSPLDDVFASAEVTAVFEEFLNKLRPDIIHFHELLGFPLSLLNSTQRVRIPTVFTSQDYYPLCPITQLYRENEACCQRRSQDLVCDQCLGHLGWDRVASRKKRLMELLGTPQRRILIKPALRANVIFHKVASVLECRRSKYQRRRPLVIEHLTKLDLMISMSKRHYEITRALAGPTVPLRQIYLSRKSYRLGCSIASNRRNKGGPVKFVAMNVHSKAKGINLLLSEFHALKTRIPDCELHIYGGHEEPEIDGVHFHGPYKSEELDEILQSYDVGIIPSIWEEAYAYVGPELLSRGIPIVVSNRGAMKEYVRHEFNGLIFDAGIQGSLAHALERIAMDHVLRRCLSKGAQTPNEAMPIFEEHVDAMEVIYRELVAGKK